MPNNVYVLVVEDDPYARDLMALMLARDWRTRVAGLLGSEGEARIKELLADPRAKVEVLILDTEVPADPSLPQRIADYVMSLENGPRIVYMCTHPHDRLLAHAIEDGAAGYVNKKDVLYSIASLVVDITEDNFIISPSVEAVAASVDLPRKTVVISGKEPVANFTEREFDILRLGILFNVSQRDMADELIISRDWIAEVMGNVYEKLQLKELFQGEVLPESLLEDAILVERFNHLLKKARKQENSASLRNAPNLKSLAFHLLTIPSMH